MDGLASTIPTKKPLRIPSQGLFRGDYRNRKEATLYCNNQFRQASLIALLIIQTLAERMTCCSEYHPFLQDDVPILASLPRLDDGKCVLRVFIEGETLQILSLPSCYPLADGNVFRVQMVTFNGSYPAVEKLCPPPASMQRDR